MKKFITVNLFLFAFISLKAQDPSFTLFRQNNLWLNPASGGMEDKHIFSLSGRTQWSTYHTAVLTYEQPLKKINSGVGAVGWYEQDGVAPIRTYYAGLCYDYIIELTEKMKLGIGVEGAFAREIFNREDLKDFNYLSFNAGVWYKWSDFYAGVSVKHFESTSLSSGESAINYIDRYMILTAGYTWKFSKDFSMIPSAIYFRQDDNDFFEINDELCLDDIYFLGGGIRPSSNVNPVIISAGIKLKKKLQLMLSYDVPDKGATTIDLKYRRAYETNIKYRF